MIMTLPTTARQRQTLAANIVPVIYEAGEVIVAEGEPADCMYLLHGGAAAAEVAGAVVARYEAAEFFGERGLLSRTGGEVISFIPYPLCFFFMEYH